MISGRSPQPTLFDLDEGLARQAEGRARALANDATVDDQDAIWSAIEALRRNWMPFHADDVWAWCEAHGCPLSPGANLGAVFRAACEQRLIRPMKGMTVQSKRPAAQGRKFQVWIGVS